MPSPTEVTAPVDVNDLKAALQPFRPELLNALLSDLQISVNPSGTNICSRVAFTVKLVPGILAQFRPERKHSVDVLVYDDRGDYRLISVDLSSHGESISRTVEMPTTLEGQRKLSVVVDPFRKFAERNEGNNVASTEERCIR